MLTISAGRAFVSPACRRSFSAQLSLASAAMVAYTAAKTVSGKFEIAIACFSLVINKLVLSWFRLFVGVNNTLIISEAIF